MIPNKKSQVENFLALRALSHQKAKTFIIGVLIPQAEATNQSSGEVGHVKLDKIWGSSNRIARLFSSKFSISREHRTDKLTKLSVC